MTGHRLLAGAASLDLVPPLGMTMVGHLRRSVSAQRYGAPLQVGALVLDDSHERLVIVSADVIATPGTYATRLREAIAQAADTEPCHVLVNSSHSHAAPPLPGMPKLGGLERRWTESELRFPETLIELASSAASLAVSRLRPARVGAARVEASDLSVNRRQRDSELGTIMGWNPDEACDRGVPVLRIDDLAGASITTLVCYACHPVVVGPDVADFSSDFVGSLRSHVRRGTGGDCQFLQACGGNILPLEAFFDRQGPEEDFGRRLALHALLAREWAETMPTQVKETPYASAHKIAVWRREPTGKEHDYSLGAAERTVRIPLQSPPGLDEIRSLRNDLERRVEDLKQSGAPPEEWNPPSIHIDWAADIERSILDGAVSRELEAPIQALRIGKIGIVALPFEPFCEIGLEINAHSPASFPITLGYSNDALGYLPTEREFGLRGYEPTISHRHYGKPSPVVADAAQLVVRESLELIATLFASELP
jgi:hypothetical protein